MTRVYTINNSITHNNKLKNISHEISDTLNYFFLLQKIIPELAGKPLPTQSSHNSHLHGNYPASMVIPIIKILI